MATSKERSQLLSHGSAEAADFPCSICQTRDKREVESSKYCVNCDSNMCAACTESHACWPAMASHQVVDISRAPGIPVQKPQLPTQRCDEHHGRVLDQYCEDDDKVACEICVNIYHRNCEHMKYIPKIAKGTSKNKSLTAVKISTDDILTKLKQLKTTKDEKSKELDKAEVGYHQEVQDLRTTLHKYADNLADTEDAKIKSEFQKKKGEVQQDIAVIDHQIDATDIISKKLNDCKVDNESELFVYIKQGENVERDTQQILQTLRQSNVSIPTYKIKSTIKKSLNDLKSLGQFEKITSAKLKTQIKVRGAQDEYDCRINGICLLPDASLIIADTYNRNLKLVDAQCTLAGNLNLLDEPYDVCYTSNNKVAVTLPHANKIQFVSVGSTMQKTHFFNIGDFCTGIDYSNNQLYICCGRLNTARACVRVYSLSGTLLRTIQYDQAGKTIFTFPCHIVVSSCGSKLHVTDMNNRIVTTDTSGKLLAIYTDPDLKSPHGICCLDKGDLLICDYQASCIHHVSKDSRKLGKLLTVEDGIAHPRAVCYDPAHSKLLVPMEDCMKTYDIQYTCK